MHRHRGRRPQRTSKSATMPSFADVARRGRTCRRRPARGPRSGRRLDEPARCGTIGCGRRSTRRGPTGARPCSAGGRFAGCLRLDGRRRSRSPTTQARREPSPSPLLRTEFDVTAPVASARLYVTSLGVYQMFVNGAEVSDALLSPGWSTLRQADRRQHLRRHRACSESAANALGGVLGDGWYRGRLGWNPGKDRCHYGTELGLLAQLEVTYDEWHHRHRRHRRLVARRHRIDPQRRHLRRLHDRPA